MTSTADFGGSIWGAIMVMLWIWLLTHWGWVTHICVHNLTIIGRHQAIITWTNVGILLIGPLGTNFSVMLIEIHAVSFNKIHLKMSSGKWRPFCLCLNVLTLNIYIVAEIKWPPFAFAENIFNFIFLSEKIVFWFKFLWKLFARALIVEKSALVAVMTWHQW